MLHSKLRLIRKQLSPLMMLIFNSSNSSSNLSHNSKQGKDQCREEQLQERILQALLAYPQEDWMELDLKIQEMEGLEMIRLLNNSSKISFRIGSLASNSSNSSNNHNRSNLVSKIQRFNPIKIIAATHL